MHLLVDGLCVCCLYLVSNANGVEDVVAMFVIYNVMAFLTQPFTGMVADVVPDHRVLLLSALGFLSVGCLVAYLGNVIHEDVAPSGWSFALAFLLGGGNSLFHVWGGRQTVVTAGNDPVALGTFVSTGALGLAVGMVFASWQLMAAMLVAMAALSAAYIVLLNKKTTSCSRPSQLQPVCGRVCMAVVAVVVVLVVFRSFVSQGFSSPASDGDAAVLAVGLVAMFGKMAGGWLARLMGMAPSMLLIVSVVFCCYLCAAIGFRWILLIGLFAVNCTMPVTLCLANDALKGREGLAFGLLAAALMPGYLLAML